MRSVADEKLASMEASAALYRSLGPAAALAIANSAAGQDAMAQFNVVGTPVKSGQHIDLGTPITPLNEERKRLLQDMADEFHARFRRVVCDARPEVDPADNTNFDGRVFTASQAMALP